uniref:Protein kinase domain-containing protein n=1 Tax=Guillardia theta (strain CCMP2712) TaxID=905079 RepID=A0A0C3U6N5_GUITC
MYRLIAKKGEGTFSEVLKAQCVKNGKMTAIKCMKSQFESEEQVNNLREIQALRRLSPHPGIIKLVEVLYEQPTGRLALASDGDQVFELMDMNIYELIRGRRQYLPEARIKSYMYQLIKAMDHMHRNGIFHRDIKPENILISDDVLKLADFGSCRGIYSKQPYTEYISTRWYRAPECLLTDGYYNYKMDLWGVGCVFFEIISLYPLFPAGTNELDQIHKIHNILGTPPQEILEKFKRHATHMELNFPPKEGSGVMKLIPHALEDCIDLILKLLTYNPEDRLSARQALRHAFFKDLRDMDKRVKRELLAQKVKKSLLSSSCS